MAPVTLTIVRAVQTCDFCPSQWDAWTDTGQYLYLRYRCGRGTADDYPDNRDELWDRIPYGRVAYFENEDGLDGIITLEEFCRRAGLHLADNAATV